MRGCVKWMVVVGAVLFALPALAQEKTYTNEDFKFMLKYPGDWKMAEESPKAEMKVGRGMFGVDVGKAVGMPRMAQACFAQKKCSPGDTKKGPEYHLMMNEIRPVKRQAGAPSEAGEEKRRARTKRERGEREKPECDIIARGRVSWAGKGSPFITMRCPEKGRWRYTTSLNMRRTVRGRNNMYMMQCTLLTKEKDKAKSLPEYRAVLKPRCDRAIASSRMLR